MTLACATPPKSRQSRPPPLGRGVSSTIRDLRPNAAPILFPHRQYACWFEPHRRNKNLSKVACQNGSGQLQSGGLRMARRNHQKTAGIVRIQGHEDSSIQIMKSWVKWLPVFGLWLQAWVAA